MASASRPRRGAPPADVTGLVLAGGRGERLGGRDKGLVEVAGRRLVEWVAARLAPQVSGLFISANRHLGEYAGLGHPVLPDEAGDHRGPLAGMAAGLLRCPTRWLAVVPCDSPFLPLDLVARLHAAATRGDGELAVVRTDERLQPVFVLLRHDLGPSLERYLDAGERKVEHWYARHRVVPVTFEDRTAFDNINDPASLAAAAARLAA